MIFAEVLFQANACVQIHKLLDFCCTECRFIDFAALVPWDCLQGTPKYRFQKIVSPCKFVIIEAQRLIQNYCFEYLSHF